MTRGKGFIQLFDPRDEQFPLSIPLAKAPPSNLIVSHWEHGPILDQGSTSSCVGHAAQQILTSTPFRQKGESPFKFYKWAQDHDEFPPGTQGTSIRAGCEALKHFGYIKAYYWAKDVTQMAEYVQKIGPLFVGTDWLTGMDKPDHLGLVQVRGNSTGGHAWVINHVDLQKGIFGGVNSWGPWGPLQGRFLLPIEGFAELFKRGAVAAAVQE